MCELRSTVAALKMQIQELGDALKSTVAGHHTNYNTVNQGNQGNQGGRASGRGTRGGNKGNGGLVGGRRGDNRYGSGAIGREVGHKTKDGVSSGKAVQREVVSGVRRLWGTVKSTSHFSVKNTIVKLAKVESVDSIQVKRLLAQENPSGGM